MGGLSFLQPWLLWGLAAVSVPLILHLIHRRKAILWRFSALEFLLRSHRRVVKRLRLKQWLLLLLRCLFVACLALALAKPFWRQAGGATPGTPLGVVLIVDDSLSMSYRDGKESLFARAQKQALQYLSSLRGEDRVALLRGSPQQTPDPLEQREFTFDKEAVSALLRRWKPSWRSTALPEALKRAAALLQEAKGIRPRVVLFSDMARHAWPPDDSPLLAGLPPAEIVLFRPQKPPQNQAVLEVQTRRAPLAGPQAYRFTATLRNFSSQPVRDLEVALWLAGRARARGFAQLPPWGSAQKSFTVQLDRAGKYSGYVQIGKDPLLRDNRRFFVFHARQQTRILLVNGDPRTIPYLDELYYLERALGDRQASFRLTVARANSPLPDPSRFDVIFLANVSTLPADWRTLLLRFVQKGGGLFFSVGEQVHPARANRQLADLLPRPLRSKALAAQRPDGTGKAISRYFGKIAEAHPLFRPLLQEGLNFQSARVSRLMLVQPRARQRHSPARMLWHYSHGPPALLERSVGRGRVLLLTTTVDRDWTDLPIRPMFLPFVQQIVRYLAQGEQLVQNRPLLVGQTETLPLSGADPIRVHPPRGKSFLLRPSRKGKGFLFPGANRPGLYRFSRQGAPLSLLPKAVNIDPTEGDLSPLPANILKKLGNSQQKTASALFPKGSERLWPTLLLALLALLLLEAAILRFL